MKILENEVTSHADDVPVTAFEGKPTKIKKEEKVEPVTESVVEPAPAETPTEEPATIETPKQDTELDVAAEPVDKKAFYKEFREWRRWGKSKKSTCNF